MLLPVLSFLFTLSLSSGATLTVTSTGDSGSGSLRQAIADAAADDTINFELPSPGGFSLTSGAMKKER